jgi:hypothetical protein
MKLNLYFVQELLERLLSQLGFFYTPSTANKKRIKDFFVSFPFFFFSNELQNELYEIIQHKPITSYYDDAEKCQDYCYYIYSTFSIKHNLTPKTKENFYMDCERQMRFGTEQHRQWRQNNIKDYIFICLFILLFILFYFFDKKVN